MGYLERNQRLLTEVQANAQLSRVKVIADENSSAMFTALGRYRSSELGKLVHLGLKEFENQARYIEERMTGELVVIQAITEGLPNLLTQLPLLHGLLVDQKGEPIGIVTEDFSKGGRLAVEPERSDYLDLKHFLDNPEGFEMDYTRMAFRVGRQRRLGDFWVSSPNGDKYWDLLNQLQQDILRYTVRLNYPF